MSCNTLTCIKCPPHRPFYHRTTTSVMKLFQKIPSARERSPRVGARERSERWGADGLTSARERWGADGLASARERWGAVELASTGGIHGGTIDMNLKRQQEH
jgi:hypothetical protein